MLEKLTAVYETTSCFVAAYRIKRIVVIQSLINRGQGSKVDIAYNIFSIIDMTVWIRIFYNIYRPNRLRHFLLAPAAMAFLYSIAEIVVIGKITHLHRNSMMAYNMTVIVTALGYLCFSLYKTRYYPGNDPGFWLCAACIGYHSLLFLNFVTLMLPAEYWLNPFSYTVWDIVALSAAIFYYLLLSIAFISCTKVRFRPIFFQL